LCVVAVVEMLKSLSSAIIDQRRTLKQAIERDCRETIVSPLSIKYTQSLQQTLQDVCYVLLRFALSTCSFLVPSFVFSDTIF